MIKDAFSTIWQQHPALCIAIIICVVVGVLVANIALLYALREKTPKGLCFECVAFQGRGFIGKRALAGKCLNTEVKKQVTMATASCREFYRVVFDIENKEKP